MNLAEEFNPYPKTTYKRVKRKRVDRGKFSDKVRKEIKEHFNNQCQECGIIKPHLHIHHVKPKGSGVGRGIFTNGLLLCNPCHRKIHDEKDQTRLHYWQDEYRKLYGKNYFKDKEDLIQEASECE
jgi:predicted restriction endonuclease